MSKICVVQFYTSNLSYGQFAEDINRKYCETHGYDYFVEKDDKKLKFMADGRAFTWIKPKLIGEVLGKYDYVLFMDIDAIFCDFKKRIEEFIESGFDLVAAEDYSSHSKMNAGVLLFRNCNWTHNFLENWWEKGEILKGSDIPELGLKNDQVGYFKHGYWHDQSCLSYLYLSGNQEHIKIIPHRSFNWWHYNQDNFIFHAFAHGHIPHRSLDRIHADFFGLKKDFGQISLLQLANMHGTDKEGLHKYVSNHYERLFSPLKMSAKRICEIGVAWGSSLRMLRDYFPNAEVVGCDLEDMSLGEDRISVVKMNQSLKEDLDYFCKTQDEFDIIIDDGSHCMKDQQSTLVSFFKILKPGGLYIIEDLHTSVDTKNPEKQHLNYGNPNKVTTLELLQNFIDSGHVYSEYLTDAECAYLKDNMDSCEILRKDGGDFSITSAIRKKQDPSILFLAYTSKTYDHGIQIDRSDLTRKMSCMETWVPRIESLGHEVIFFDGGNESQSFDMKNKVLHLVSDESYDADGGDRVGKGSFMFERFREAILWCLENRSFNYLFRTDDGSYINAWKLPDIMSQLDKRPDVLFSVQAHGGAGILFSRKACEMISMYENKSKMHIEDRVIFNFVTEKSNEMNVMTTDLLYGSYVVGENLFTFHYTNGKRQYFSDDIISYYYNGLPIKRKIMINFPFNLMSEENSYLRVRTWSFGESDRTPIWYSFEKDDKNWEYYGNWPRSGLNQNQFCPFGSKSIYELSFWNTYFDLSSSQEENVFLKYLDCIMDGGKIYFNFTEDFYKGSNSHLNFELFLEKIRAHLEVIVIDENFDMSMKINKKFKSVKARKK